MAPSTVNYRNTLFEHTPLPKHTGEPTFEIIRTLHNLLKTNSSDVLTSLGGANHGYLGLLLSDASYALVSPAPFIRPLHPGILVIPDGTTLHMTTTLRDQHKEALRLFLECKNVEKALQQQLSEAIDNIYLDALRDANTNALNVPIRDVLQYLYDTYGDIAPEILTEKRQIVEQMVFDPSLPIDVLFNAIEVFTDIAESARAPLTQVQCINIAYVILKKSNTFSTYLIKWDAKLPIQKTWIQFKVEFRQAVKELRRTGSLQVQHLHANLVSEIVSGIQEAIQPSLQSSPSLAITDITEDTSLAPTINLNAAVDPTIAALQTQMQTMQTGMNAMMNQMQQMVQGGGQQNSHQQNSYQGGRHGGRSRGRGRGRGGRGGRNPQNPFVQNFSNNPFLQQSATNPFQPGFQQQQ